MCPDKKRQRPRGNGSKSCTGGHQTKLSLELDCDATAKALRSHQQDISQWWITYEEAKKLLMAFKEYTICLVKRDCNTAADALANHARPTSLSAQGESIYPIIRELVNRDSVFETNN
jgi:hypothetical protein